MRRLDLLITEARTESDNLDYSDDTGLQQSEFIRWANLGQTSLASVINQTFPKAFLKEKVITAVAGTEAYTIPNDVFYSTRVKQVDFSRTGLDQDYYKMKEGYLSERINTTRSTPVFYIRRGSQYLIQPPPDTNGTIRLNYQKKFKSIDIRRGTVSAVTLNGGGLSITSLTFDPAEVLDATLMGTEGYICIVDKDGVTQMNAIPIQSVDETTGVVTLVAGFTYESGETIAVGNYAVIGKYATTHSELVDEAERYITEYMIWKAKKRDSSDDSVESNEELKSMANEIAQVYGQESADINYVPIIDDESYDFDSY